MKRLSLVLLFSLAFMAAPAHAATVAVLLSHRAPEYMEALKGFTQTVVPKSPAGSSHTIAGVWDMDGDPVQGLKQVIDIETKVKPDLIFVVGASALQVVINRPVSVPVIYAMVLNPPSTVPPIPKNMTGASMNVPVEDTLRLFKLLGVKRIGAIYTKDRTGYLIRQAQAVANALGLTLVTRDVKSSKDVPTTLPTLKDQVDALWLMPDESLLQQSTVDQMLLFSSRQNVPLLGLSDRQADKGALLVFTFIAEDIGRQAGDLALAVLSGRPPADLPYTIARKFGLIVNLKIAHKLNLIIPQDILDRATNVIQ